jgi:bifunctional non-homologous end joining protein LigD
MDLPFWDSACLSWPMPPAITSAMPPRILSFGFIAPCLPSRAERPPSGPGWVHEIKHDGFRMMVRRDGAVIRLLTRRGHDWTDRFPLISQAAGALRVRSFLLDGEAVACDRDGLPSFDRLRYRRGDGAVFLFAFDLLELNGDASQRAIPAAGGHALAEPIFLC